MLVSAKEMLDKAKAGHYAVGQFNINNLEWTKSVLLTAQELKSPVILGVSEGAGKYMTGFKTVAAMVKAMDEELGITVPVALHLDHGTYEGCYKCIKAGFTSIMFDGSHYPIEENVEKTKEIISINEMSEIPIYQQIRNQIVQGISDGRLSPGEQLPTVRGLAEEIGINSMTVNKAYSLLKQEGYIFADRRSGARVRKEFAVTKELSEKSKELLQQIISEAKVSGMTKEEFFEICGKLYE